MLLSIVIPTCNRADLLSKCLEKLIPQLADDEIIVTDDSTATSTREILTRSFSRVKYIKGPKNGPAANRNNGAGHAKGEWLVFIDDDVIPADTLIENYRIAIGESSGVKAFEGAILPDDISLLEKDMAECPVNTGGGCFWSANICVKREVFESLGGFDENFRIAAQEDQDIYIRLKEVTVIKFVKDAFVTHPVRIVSLRKKLRLIPKALKNWMYFSLKHHGFFRMVKDGFLSQIIALRKAIIDGRKKMAVYHVCTLFLLLPGIVFFNWTNVFRLNDKKRNQVAFQPRP